jgi:unsaturated chondroitin disaccharide hydrolase
MNAPLLIEAGRSMGGATGDRLAARGLTHMLTLADDFIRGDGSTIHRQVYNPRTGSLIGPVYGQGRSTASAWSRGQAWAINGFTQAFALTGDPRMLDAARRTADYWLSRVPAGCVPAWDLDVNSDTAPRDSSAAAIAADGLSQLGRVDPDPVRAAGYLAAGRATTTTLTEPAWVPDTARHGVLQRQAYNIPAVAREGTYAWGDTYLLLALSRSG